MERILKYIHAAHAYRRGVYGRNVGIAVMDTGIFPHQDLKNRIVFFRDYVNGRSLPYDDNGHGTHIAGIIAGSGHVRHGIAPESVLYGFKVLDEKGNGRIQDTCRALEDILRMNRNHTAHVRIINISVGMTEHVQPNLQSRLLETVEEAWDAGIVVLAAAGNNGPGENTVTSPGISKKIITVGSLDDGTAERTGFGRRGGYSGRGPTDACVIKPEILMPGTNILSCENSPQGYVRKSGTSMAVPVLTGVIALLLSEYPSLTPNEIKLRLYYAADKAGLKGGQKSWGTVSLDGLLP